MKLALIPPIYNQYIAGQDPMPTFMVLAHLLKHKEYMQYYHGRMKNRQGCHIIVDNGAYEDEGMNLADVLRVTKQMGGAHTVALPDVLHDSTATYLAAQGALFWLATDEGMDAHMLAHSPQFMLIPQGESYAEWDWCLKSMYYAHQQFSHDAGTIELKRPMIGIAKHHEHSIPGGCLSLIEAATLYDCDIHLLGWSHSNTVYQAARNYPQVKSVDTARPFVHALAYQDFSKGQKGPASRPKDYFMRHLSDDMPVVPNIAWFEQIVKGHMPEDVA